MKTHRHNWGFTIVELLIATSVFSVVITIGLYSFLQVSRLYTKGINSVRTQDAARNLIMDVSTQFQLSTGQYTGPQDTADGFKYFCVGNKGYRYKYNQVESKTAHYLISYNITQDQCQSSGTNEQYLLLPGSRVLQFSVEPRPLATGPLYKISVILLYSDKEAGSPDDEPGNDIIVTGDPDSDMTQWRCKSTVRGSEYCSITNLTTSVYKRT